MFRRIAVLLVGTSLLVPMVVAQVAPPPSQPAARSVETYQLDADHTSVVFGVGHNGLSLVYGMFKKAQGGYIIDRVYPERSRFRFSVDVRSIDTGQPERDAHLLRADFFDAARFPKMTFDSVSCTVQNNRDGIVFNVLGDMTIHGETRRMTLPLRMVAEGEGVSLSQTKDRRTGFLCQFELRRSDFGMNQVPVVGDSVGITISFEGILQPTEPAPETARRY